MGRSLPALTRGNYPNCHNFFCDYLQLFAKNRNFRVFQCQSQSQGYFCPMDYLIVGARAVTTRHSATRWAQNHVLFSKYSRFSPCALLFLQVPTTVSSAPWHFSWLRRRSLPERLFPRLCGQQDMATRRCVDSVWVCHHRIAAATTTPTPYRCRLHHQLLRPQSFLS